MIERTQSDRLRETWTESPWGRIHALTNRDRPPRRTPVLLGHGFVISSAYMVPTAHLLAPLCPVYVVDLPGYGASDRPPQTPSLRELADVLAAWMEANRIPSAHLLANSYGCQIFAEFAIRHPRKVRRMVLQGPTIDPHHRSIPGQMLRLQLTSFFEERSIGKVARNDYFRAGIRQILGTTRHAFADRVEEKLPRIRVPVLVVRGSKDFVVTAKWAQEAAQLLPRGRLRTIPGQGHALNYSAPKELLQVALPFFRMEPSDEIAA
jgi:2-hydroxy-6-oxonona-2,4-dienedioate hydrolase